MAGSKNKMSLVDSSGAEIRTTVPKIAGVRPLGSKVYIEVIEAAETIETSLVVTKAEHDGAPQAYVVALGPGVPPEHGLKVGSRVYWNGKGVMVEGDPSNTKGRTRALMELHNIIAVIDEA